MPAYFPALQEMCAVGNVAAHVSISKQRDNNRRASDNMAGRGQGRAGSPAFVNCFTASPVSLTVCGHSRALSDRASVEAQRGSVATIQPTQD